MALRGAKRQEATGPDLKAQMAGEIYTAMKRLGADGELLAM
jgi:hypothetical protein